MGRWGEDIRGFGNLGDGTVKAEPAQRLGLRLRVKHAVEQVERRLALGTLVLRRRHLGGGDGHRKFGVRSAECGMGWMFGVRCWMLDVRAVRVRPLIANPQSLIQP